MDIVVFAMILTFLNADTTVLVFARFFKMWMQISLFSNNSGVLDWTFYDFSNDFSILLSRYHCFWQGSYVLCWLVQVVLAILEFPELRVPHQNVYSSARLSLTLQALFGSSRPHSGVCLPPVGRQGFVFTIVFIIILCICWVWLPLFSMLCW